MRSDGHVLLVVVDAPVAVSGAGRALQGRRLQHLPGQPPALHGAVHARHHRDAQRAQQVTVPR